MDDPAPVVTVKYSRRNGKPEYVINTLQMLNNKKKKNRMRRKMGQKSRRINASH